MRLKLLRGERVLVALERDDDRLLERLHEAVVEDRPRAVGALAAEVDPLDADAVGDLVLVRVVPRVRPDDEQQPPDDERDDRDQDPAPRSASLLGRFQSGRHLSRAIPYSTLTRRFRLGTAGTDSRDSPARASAFPAPANRVARRSAQAPSTWVRGRAAPPCGGPPCARGGCGAGTPRPPSRTCTRPRRP